MPIYTVTHSHTELKFKCCWFGFKTYALEKGIVLINRIDFGQVRNNNYIILSKRQLDSNSHSNGMLNIIKGTHTNEIEIVVLLN